MSVPRRLCPHLHPGRSLAAVFAALLCLGSPGCRAPAGEGETVEFWAMGREGELVAGLLEDFEREHGVRVRVQQIPWGAAHEKLLTAYVGGAMPDLFQVGNTWVPEFVALDAVECLDERIATSDGVDLADYFAGIVASNVVGGCLYGLPWYVDTRLLFVRSDILARAGVRAPLRTWDDLLRAATRVKDSLGPHRHAILLPMREWQVPVILAMQADARLLRDGERYGDFRSAEFRRAFGFYLDLFGRGLAPRDGEAQAANVYQDFAAGQFAMFVTGPWNIGELQRRLPSSMESRWQTAPLPAMKGDYPGVSLAGGSSLAIFKQSPRREAAWRVAEYLAAPARQVEFYRRSGDLPARRSAWRDPALARNDRAQAFWQQLQSVRSTPAIPEWERIATKIGEYAELAVRGQLSADAALAALDADVDAILEKRRWLLRRRAPEETAGPAR